MLLMSTESSLGVMKELMMSCEGEMQRKAINMLSKKLESKKKADITSTEVGQGHCSNPDVNQPCNKHNCNGWV